MAAGITLTIVGAATGSDETGLLGNAVYEYSGVSCQGLKKSAEGDNLMTLIAPQAVIAHAIQNKLTDEALKNIPIISAADKENIQKVVEQATKPPEVTVTKDKVEVKTPLGTVEFHSPF